MSNTTSKSSENNAPDAPARSDQNAKSIGSRNSFLSIGSVNSFCSIGSVNSAFSIGSAFSFGSIGSAFSSLSIASCLSYMSVLSVLSEASVLSARSYRSVQREARQKRESNAWPSRPIQSRLLKRALIVNKAAKTTLYSLSRLFFDGAGAKGHTWRRAGSAIRRVIRARASTG